MNTIARERDPGYAQCVVLRRMQHSPVMYSLRVESSAEVHSGEWLLMAPPDVGQSSFTTRNASRPMKMMKGSLSSAFLLHAHSH